MPNSSSSASSKPAPASSPSSSLPLPNRGGKRKATSISTNSAAPPLLSPANTYEDDYDESDIQKPAKKKLKKVLEKKIPVWKDLKQWKEGEQPLSVFPLEVLDMIISIDSDLDLRDHLALAATCRYFRSCYRDVVFQTLVQAAFPTLDCSPDVHISQDGEATSHYADYTYGRIPFLGPFNRSFNEARRIFSSGRSLVGAGGWNGWGLTRTEYDANQIEATKQKDVIEQLLLEYWSGRPLDWRPEMDDDPIEESQRKFDQLRLQRVFDLDLDPDDRYSLTLPLEPSLHDPWPSFWRATVVKIVNNPTLTKAEAKYTYKLTDRELLGLKEKAKPFWSQSFKHYFKAAVEALALRSHGGARGHQEYLAKLEAKKNKAQATRTKNRLALAANTPAGEGAHGEKS